MLSIVVSEVGDSSRPVRLMGHNMALIQCTEYMQGWEMSSNAVQTRY